MRGGVARFCIGRQSHAAYGAKQRIKKRDACEACVAKIACFFFGQKVFFAREAERREEDVKYDGFYSLKRREFHDILEICKVCSIWYVVSSIGARSEKPILNARYKLLDT